MREEIADLLAKFANRPKPSAEPQAPAEAEAVEQQL
jgi:hypothetical protein